MLSFDQAFAILAGAARPLGTQIVSIHAAHGRRLARPVLAEIDNPRADVSAMDGYAVREADLGLGAWRRVGASYPGSPFEGVVGAGECVRIFTGGFVPAGADRVLVQEIVTADGDAVRLMGEYGASTHIRHRATDFAVGDELLPVGRVLDRRALIALGGADAATAEVYKRPYVSILTSGDELSTPGEARETKASIPESVTLGIGALAKDYGAYVLMTAAIPDDPLQMRRVVEGMLRTSDVVIVTGGASVGEKDYSKPVLAALGVEILFSRIAIKPGKPVWFGRFGEKYVIGLPGNPTSAMVTARLFLAPLLVGLGGGDPAAALAWREAVLAAPVKACDDRETFTRARSTPEGLVPARNQDSGAQGTLAASDVLIRQVIHSPARAAGETVSVIDF